MKHIYLLLFMLIPIDGNGSKKAFRKTRLFTSTDAKS